MTKDGIGRDRKSLRSSECSRAPRLFCEEYVICLLINIFKYDSDRKVIKQCIVREIWGWDGGLNIGSNFGAHAWGRNATTQDPF